MIRLHSLDLSSDTLHLTQLPRELAAFADQLTSLHCANQPLRNENALLSRLWSLRVLYVEHGELETLPHAFAARFLFRLFVRHNRLEALPDALCSLQFLRELYVSNNRLRALPAAIGELRLLEELDVQANELTALPASLSRLESLRLLRLDRNQLAALPDELCAVTSLQELFVKSNKLTALPSGITRLVNLRRIYACYNAIAAPPPHLHLLTALQNCSFSNNAVRAFPTELRAHDLALPASLKRLILAHNNLRWLFEPPPADRDLLQSSSSSTSVGSPLASPRSPAPLRCSLAHVQHLAQLDLANNRLRALAPVIGDLRGLRILTLGNNCLSALPDALYRLTLLQLLDVSYNALDDVSIELRRLTNLASLHLSSNRLEALPDVFEQLPDLSVLMCDKNRLVELPPTLASLSAQANVTLEDNPLEPTLASLCFLGWSAVRQYLLQPDEAKNVDAASLHSSFEIDFARLQLGAELGRGAFGVVHKATLQPLPPRRRYAPADAAAVVDAPIAVAVKVLELRVDQIASEASRRRFVDDFRRELAMLAKTAQCWSFPASVRRHFVGFYGACTQGPFCLVTEFCERGSLFDLLARVGRANRLHAAVRYHIAIEVAEGLHNLHSHTPDAILHHDVKTSNILITHDYAIKLADFGLARVQASTRIAARMAADGHFLSSDEDDEEEEEVVDIKLGSQERLQNPLRDALFEDDEEEEEDDEEEDDDAYEGQLGASVELDPYEEQPASAAASSYYVRRGKGTCFFLPYAAPEVVRGRVYDIAAETYSFGVVLWCLASTCEPFTGRSLAAIRQAKASGRAMTVNDVAIDEPFRALVARATAAAREQRLSLPAIIAELRRARDAQELRVVPEDLVLGDHLG